MLTRDPVEGPGSGEEHAEIIHRACSARAHNGSARRRRQVGAPVSRQPAPAGLEQSDRTSPAGATPRQLARTSRRPPPQSSHAFVSTGRSRDTSECVPPDPPQPFACVLPLPLCQRLELKPDSHLDSPGGQRCNRSTEERGSEGANVVLVVHAVQKVESVNAECD